MTIARTIAMILGGAGLTLLPGANGLTRALILMLSTGAAIVWTKVTGTSPLSLPDAIANSIKSLTQYGLCTQSTTPTPSAPVDIVCNNGALRCGANEHNAHFVQFLNAYIKSSNRQITSYNGNSVVTYDCEVGKSYHCYNVGASGNALSVNVGYSDTVPAIGTTYSANDFESIPCPDGYRTGGLIFMAKKRYVTFIFRYDGDSSKTPESMLSQMVFTEVGKEVGTLYTDGTPEVLTVLANQNTDPTIVKATLASGTTEVRYNTTSSCIIAPVKPNTVYSIGFLTKPTGGSIFRAVTTKGLVSSSAQSVASIAYDLDMNNYATKTLNSGNEAEWMYVQLSNTMSAETFASIIIQEGNAIMPPQTATDIPMLLSVGDAKDEGEIISGGVTHRIGYHVFDGTETFSKSSAYGQAFLINAASASWGADRTASVLCTHFLGLPQVKSSQDDNTCFFNQTGHFYFRVTDNSDTDAFKAWLAEQYASGTPVIVFFVLAEETTEQGTPHALHTSAGDNTVSVTANVSPVALECEYAQAAAP